MRLVGQLFLAATAMAAANGGCDRHTQLSPRAVAEAADANTRRCVEQVMNLIALAFGGPATTVASSSDEPKS